VCFKKFICCSITTLRHFYTWKVNDNEILPVLFSIKSSLPIKQVTFLLSLNVILFKFMYILDAYSQCSKEFEKKTKSG